MNKIIVGLGLLLSTSAFAAAPAGNGNFRAAEVRAAIGAQAGNSTRVVGITTAARHVQKTPAPANARILMVQHTDGGQVRVDFVNAPLDRSMGVEVLGAEQVAKLGLLTPAEGAKLAAKESGRIYGTPAGALTFSGISRSGGSYRYTETQRAPAKDVIRTVSITGSGATAAAAW